MDTFQVNICIETLCKYIENIVSNPTEEKFHKIRMSNKAYQERILPVEGTKEFLEAAGFIEQELPFNDTTDRFWVSSVGCMIQACIEFTCEYIRLFLKLHVLSHNYRNQDIHYVLL